MGIHLQAHVDSMGSGAATQAIQTKLPENYITIWVSLMHSPSRGTWHISSANLPKNPSSTQLPDLEMLARYTRFIDVNAESQPLASMLKPCGKHILGSLDAQGLRVVDPRVIPIDPRGNTQSAGRKSSEFQTHESSLSRLSKMNCKMYR